MDFLTVLFFVLSLISSLLTGRFAGAALLRGAEEGARLALTLAGPLCLWSGFAALLEVNGWSRLLARGLRPLLRRLFPRAMDDEICAGALCGNLSANLLGLGNAATPLGVRAVQQMKVRSGGDAASDEIRRSNEYATAFVKALRNGVKVGKVWGMEGYEPLAKALTETGGSPEGADGGFLVPQDFDDMIHEYEKEYVDLSQFFAVENVRGLSGWRAVEQGKRKALPKIAEMGTIGKDDQPKFTKVTYTVDKYGDRLPVSSELLGDNTAGLLRYLAGWFGPKYILTKNTLLLALLTGLIAKEAVVSSMSLFYGFSLTASGATVALALGGTFTPVAAYAFLVFCALYTPCVAAIATIRREMGDIKWTLACLGWQLGMAYLASMLVYQIGSLLF